MGKKLLAKINELFLPFYAKIVKFGIIQTYVSLFLGENWEKETNWGPNAPMAPCGAAPLLDILVGW